MFTTLQQTLQDDYRIVPLPEVSCLREYLLHLKVDLILLTVSEADTKNCTICEQMNTFPEMQGIPVVFLTQEAVPWIEEKILALGVEDCIILPATKAMLCRKLERCMELYRLRKDNIRAEKYQSALYNGVADLVDSRDEETGDHLKNATKYFNILLQEAIANDYYKDILAEEDVNDLLRSATLHDIGKIGINDGVLRKPSSLDSDEYEHMKTHTTLGMQAFDKMIQETGGNRWLYLAKDIAYCHHERWDGTGYPNGLKGEEIPIYARIMTVADVYDALTSERCYKEALSHQQAMEIIIEGRGSLFDPRLVDLFVSANQRFEAELTGINNSSES
jgi:putative two-component system response regulator